MVVISQMIRLSEFLLAFGISFENIFLPITFIVIPFLTFTIPVAFMFAVMLSFSRMSMDGEYTAMLASGMGMKKILRPVAGLTLILVFICAYCANHLESWGRSEYLAYTFQKTQNELDNIIRTKMQPGVFVEDFLGYTFYAEKVDSKKENFGNVVICPNKTTQPDKISVVSAPRASIKGSMEKGSLTMTLFEGTSINMNSSSQETSVSKFDRLEFDILRIFREQLFGTKDQSEDYRSLATPKLYSYLKTLEDSKETNSRRYLKPLYLFHYRIASCLSPVIFGIFGILLGISDQRRPKGRGYAYAILSVVFTFIFVNSMRGPAANGLIPAEFAAWFPNTSLLIFGIFLLYRRNKLPPSEPALSLKNLPLIGRR